MKTKSLNTLLKHKFFLYGMIALSVLQLVNFYRTRSLSCLGTFGVAYYLGCMMTKNKALCLLFAILVSTFIMGCEGRFVTVFEGMNEQDCASHTDEATCSADENCTYQPEDPNAEPPTSSACVNSMEETEQGPSECSSYTTAEDCVSPCNWENDQCLDQ